MTYDAWKAHYTRLCAKYKHPIDGEECAAIFQKVGRLSQKAMEIEFTWRVAKARRQPGIVGGGNAAQTFEVKRLVRDEGLTWADANRRVFDGR